MTERDSQALAQMTADDITVEMLAMSTEEEFTEMSPADKSMLQDMDALVTRMRQVCEEVDPPPAGLADRVGFSLTLDALHADVAEIQQDSLVGMRTAGVQTEEVKTLTFGTESLSLMVSAEPMPDDSGNLRVDGWLAGEGVEAGVTIVRLRTPSELHQAVVDDSGRLVWHNVASELMRFTVVRGDGFNSIVTPEVFLSRL